jgi:hypothetical protein
MSSSTNCGFFLWRVLADLDEVEHEFETPIIFKKPGLGRSRTPSQDVVAESDSVVFEQKCALDRIVGQKRDGACFKRKTVSKKIYKTKRYGRDGRI